MKARAQVMTSCVHWIAVVFFIFAHEYLNLAVFALPSFSLSCYRIDNLETVACVITDVVMADTAVLTRAASTRLRCRGGFALVRAMCCHDCMQERLAASRRRHALRIDRRYHEPPLVG